VLGFSLAEGYSCTLMQDKILEEKKLPENYNQEILEIQETRVNIKNDNYDCILYQNNECPYRERYNVFIPINGGCSWRTWRYSCGSGNTPF